MKISRFIHVLNDKTVWDALNKKVISLDAGLINFVKENKFNNNITTYPELLKEYEIVLEENQEQNLIDSLKEKTTDRQFQSLYLITTTSCNLDCDYCFYRSSASGSLKHRENMSFEVAKIAIDKFFEVVSNNIIDNNYWQQITFYGGEPLINKKLLMKAIPYASEKFNDNFTSLVINTNLVLLDDDLISLFKRYGVEVQVSLDGSKQQHDLHRKTIAGVGSYDMVINNIKKLIKNGVKVLPMITATDANVNNFSDTLYEIVNELGIDDFAVNILITNSFETDNSYPLILAQEMIKAYDKFGKLANDCVFVDLFNMIIGNNKELAKNSCGSTRKITVFPNGDVYSCQALEKIDINKMGDINTNFINNKNWELWRKRNRFNNQECLDCEVIASCGGGCATGSYNGTGSIYGTDLNQCLYTKELFKELIKRKY